MSASDDYIASLRGIRVSEVDLFRQRRDNGVFREVPPAQALWEAATIAAWTLHQAGKVITAESLYEQAKPELTQLQVAELLESPLFRQALEARGIPGAGTLNRLSVDQLTALQVMTDPSVDTPPMRRLKKLGITYKRWQGWLREPLFAAAYQDLLAKLDDDVVGPIKMALQRSALAGDVNAAKLALELSGDYVPGGSTIAAMKSADIVVQRLQEAIDLFVDDEARAKIAHFVATGEMPLGELEAVPYVVDVEQ